MTDDRQQHIDTLARCILTGDEYSGDVIDVGNFLRRDAAAIFDSADAAVHDALTAALIAHADRGRVLAALADAGWLDEEAEREPEPPRPKCDACATGINSTCADCGCCNHEWDDDCGCAVKACGCYEARLDREAEIAEGKP